MEPAPQFADRPARTVIAFAAVVVAVLAVPLTSRIAEAEQLCAAAMTSRDASVRAQLTAGADPIVVTPAPLLFYPAEGRDFESRAVQPQDWFWPRFRSRFGVLERVSLRYMTIHPRDYCVDDPQARLTSNVLPDSSPGRWRLRRSREPRRSRPGKIAQSVRVIDRLSES